MKFIDLERFVGQKVELIDYDHDRHVGIFGKTDNVSYSCPIYYLEESIGTTFHFRKSQIKEIKRVV